MPTGTSRWGSVAWGASGAAAAGSGLVLDVLNAYNDVIYRLGFAGPRDLVSTSWVIAGELYQWADEAAKKLSYESALFLTYDNTVAVVAGTALYTLPATHVFTVAAALIYAGGRQLLRLSSVSELFALNAVWSTATGSPTRVSMDSGGVGTATLYPSPTANAVMGLVCQEYPGTVTASASTLPLPTVLQDYFSYAMLAGARGKESDAAMPEMAAHFRERIRMYEALIDHLWGPGA